MNRIVLILCVLCVCVQSLSNGMEGLEESSFLAKEHLPMYSRSYALMDGESLRVLTGKEEKTPMANASTTKILTCIVTLENAKIDEVVTISRNASNQPKVRYGMAEGSQYILKELLYGLMLESYNDCAVAIAEHVAGSEAEFAKLLNKKAKEIGCKDTYFITPNGLDAEDKFGFHHTSATDLCRMMAYCVWESSQKEMFLEITGTKQYGDFINRNAFLGQMDGVLSGKTGFTSKAGYCYVAALEQNGEKYCIALLACGWPNNKNYKWKDARELFTYGLEHYEMQEFSTREIENEIESMLNRQIQLEGYAGCPKFSELNETVSLDVDMEKTKYKVLLADGEEIRKEVIFTETIELPMEENAVLGRCDLYIGSEKVASMTLFLSKNAQKWTYKKVLELILNQFLIICS